MGPTWPFLLMYESHNMRHTGFLRLIVVNCTLEIGASQNLKLSRHEWIHDSSRHQKIVIKIFY